MAEGNSRDAEQRTTERDRRRERGKRGTPDTQGRPHAPVTYSAGPGVCTHSASSYRGLDMRYHGAAEIRGIDCPRSRYYDSGRFGRMFPSLPPFDAERDSLAALGAAGGPMDPNDQPPPAPPSAENKDNPAGLPAGFTFLGQLIDHDITFDPTSSLERQVDPEAVSNFRTPTLELDNVYGAGPGASPHLYQRRDPAKLLIGLDTEDNPNDLPRNPEDVALIGDPRNDENLIVSQLHLAFLKFHNAVVDHLRNTGTEIDDIFQEAQRKVRWHYQWMIVHEFLPHTVGQDVVDDILGCGRQFYDWRNEPFIPVEFSVAAYRFGHSQVRPGYRISDGFAAAIFAPTSGTQPTGLPNDLSGGRRIQPAQALDWTGFFELGGDSLQLSKAIDTKLSSPLLNLPFPSGTAADPKSLASRNLLRHITFGLPSGQDVARAMRIPRLERDELSDARDLGFDRRTPLWFYILKESELRTDGARLGPVGGRIVAEVMIGLMEGDPQSYLWADPDWTPDLGSSGEFTMADLLTFAQVA